LYEQGKPIQDIRAFIEDKYEGDFLHPVLLEGGHADVDCDACHSGSSLSYICAACHQPPENHRDGACDTCHTSEGWSE